MGFTVYLVRSSSAPLTGGELRKYFRGRSNLESASEGTMLVVTYRNPLTGAGCVFRFDSGGLKEAGKLLAEAYRGVQLSCTIDYLRPSYFAYEASVEIGRLVDALSLSVMAPEGRKNKYTPGIFKGGEMLADWQEANRAAVSAHMKKNGPVPVVHPKYSGLLWKYLLVRERMKEKLGSGVAVPEIEVMRAGDGTRARTMIRWDDCEPMALPQCQSVLVRCVRRKGIFGFGRKVEEGIASYADVIEVMKPFLEKVSMDRPGYGCFAVSTPVAKEARKAFCRIPLNPLPEGLQQVTPSNYVDVLPAVKARG